MEAQLVRSVVSSLAGCSQSSRLLRLHTPLGADVLLAESLHGEEGIDIGFKLQISALSTNALLSLKSVLGQPVLIELLASAEGTLRPFHGYVTAAELCGANGGLARYKLTIEPWTAFLALGRDSRAFHDKSIFDIIEAVFCAYGGKAKLAPAWRIAADPALYPVRSLTTQYQESDLTFITRLMNEEGLFAFYEHEGDQASTSLGSHTLVIADSNDAFVPNARSAVRFTQSGATMAHDSVDRWRAQSRLLTNAVALRSWDYRTRSTRDIDTTGVGAIVLRSTDAPGAYAYTNREHGERIAERQLQALLAQQRVVTGAGTVRTFAPGTTFSLSEHPSHDESASMLIVRVRHLAHNNLHADMASQVAAELGADPVAVLNLTELAHSLHSIGKGVAERPVYRNRFDAIDAALHYRSSQTDGHGQVLHPRPTIRGQQTAIVVGPAGVPVHTDRDHRVKVQFHWQRGETSHNRLEHPYPSGHAGAPGDETAGTWVRVATPLAPLAGTNWGSHALPRVGQEVLVDFLDGNIDRPVIIGVVYNGQGQTDAQGNSVGRGAGRATGNAGPWFPGQADDHAHPAVLSGLKSQTLCDSASGTGGYGQLVFDDSAGQARLALQRHARAHEGTHELNLGQLRHQSDNRRLDAAGFGAELKSEHAVALRSGRGMLLTTDLTSDNASSLDAGPALSQIRQAVDLHVALAETAGKHHARLAGEVGADSLPAVAALAHTGEVLGSTNKGTVAACDGSVTAFKEPILQLFTAAGIAALTPASTVVASRDNTSIAAAQDINFAAQAGLFHEVKGGIGLFTYGKATGARKPNTETGIRLHAASGKVSVQSQGGATQLTANKRIMVASTTKTVALAAMKHVMLTAQGAYIKLSDGNIELHGPGTMSFKATCKELAGPRRDSITLPALPKGQAIVDALERPAYSQQIVAPQVNNLAPEFAGLPYQVWLRGTSTQIASGTLDDEGKSARFFTEAPEELTIIVGTPTWQMIIPSDSGPSSKADDHE